MRPYLDKQAPEVWQAASAYAAAVARAAAERGISAQETEFIKVRASQLNGCTFCLDLHSRQARQTGIPQQKLDLLPIWRESGLYSDREAAMLRIVEAATRMPLDEDAEADLADARGVLGDEAFTAAEWVAVTINAFNRISILSGHPVRPRDADGKVSS